MMPLSAAADENEKNGRNTIINCKSGLSMQHDDNIPNIAPDYENVSIMKLCRKTCTKLTAPKEGIKAPEKILKQ